MRWPAVGDLCLLSVLIAVLLASVIVPIAGPTSASEHGDADIRTTIHVSIQADGDARLTVTMRYPLETANETAAFERLGREFENGTTDVLSIEPFRTAAAGAADVTGRSMTISAVDRVATRDSDVGRLELSFNWSGFARSEEDRLYVGDVFQTPSGTWLPELSATQELVLSVPDRFTPVSLDRPLRNGSIVIQGPVAFDPGEPAATFQRTGRPMPSPTVTATPTRTASPTSTATRSPTAQSPTAVTPTSPRTTTTEPPAQRGFGPLVGILLGIVLVGGLAYLAWTRGDAFPGGATDSAAAEESAPDSSSAANGGAAEATGEEPLLSDAELVLNLLEDNDGRMKQTAIVEETDWSNAKVSQLLSELEDEGAIEKLRIGRENLITLPGDVPEGAE